MPIGDSSFLMHVAYEAASFQMTVTMKNGAQYVYFMVYPNTYEDWTQAKNKGEFYAKSIKGQHQSTRVVNKSIGKKKKKRER